MASHIIPCFCRESLLKFAINYGQSIQIGLWLSIHVQGTVIMHGSRHSRKLFPKQWSYVIAMRHIIRNKAYNFKWVLKLLFRPFSLIISASNILSIYVYQHISLDLLYQDQSEPSCGVRLFNKTNNRLSNLIDILQKASARFLRKRIGVADKPCDLHFKLDFLI